jgi:hypothetical protein
MQASIEIAGYVSTLRQINNTVASLRDIAACDYAAALRAQVLLLSQEAVMTMYVRDAQIGTGLCGDVYSSFILVYVPVRTVCT